MTTIVGSPKATDAAENSLEMENRARFAVDEHNKQNPGTNLSYKRLLSAKTQVVAGTMYHLEIEADSPMGTRVYNAKVWVKPWENLTELNDFKATGACAVPVDDPMVKEATEHAMKGLQQRSNSLVPYELEHVVEAHAEGSRVDLVLEVKRGAQEKKHVKAQVNRSDNGKWTVGKAHII